MFIPQTKDTEEGKTDKPEPENCKNSNEIQETSKTSRDGQKDNDRMRVRNRRYKIKRFRLQPKNSDVKRNGRIVRRMVARRQTIYPTTPRKQEY